MLGLFAKSARATLKTMNRIRLLLDFGFKALLVVWFLRPVQAPGTEADVCAVCGKPFVDVYYSIEDQVTHEKKHVCRDCEQSYPICFVCGLPANTNAPGFVPLPDLRALCDRDARTAVLREEDGLRTCHEVRDGLDRLFSRFTTFPDTNVTVGLVDRVQLLDLFKVAGNDYHCPNVLGYTQSKTNHHRIEYRISLMSGLPLSWFEATCAHEYTHVWVGEHVSPARKRALRRDAEEGFCELVSFLYMQSQNDEAQKAFILRNAYTRGQIDLFVEAERSYGFNEVVDWMQRGTDDQLSAAEPGRIRKLEPDHPARTRSTSLPVSRAWPAPASDTLALKAVFWDPKRPVALINDHAFVLNEEAMVRLGNSNVLVRCVGILPDAVQLRVAGADQPQTLRFKSQ